MLVDLSRGQRSKARARRAADLGQGGCETRLTTYDNGPCNAKTGFTIDDIVCQVPFVATSDLTKYPQAANFPPGIKQNEIVPKWSNATGPQNLKREFERHPIHLYFSTGRLEHVCTQVVNNPLGPFFPDIAIYLRFWSHHIGEYVYPDPPDGAFCQRRGGVVPVTLFGYEGTTDGKKWAKAYVAIDWPYGRNKTDEETVREFCEKQKKNKPCPT